MKKYKIVDSRGNVLKKSDNLLKLLKIVRCSIGPRYDRCVYSKYFDNPIHVVDSFSGEVMSSFDLDFIDSIDYDRFEYFYENTKRHYDSFDLRWDY